MAEVYKDLIIRVGAETQEFDRSLSEINKEMKNLKARMNELTLEEKFSNSAKRAVILKEKVAIVKKEIADTAEKIALYSQALEDAKKNMIPAKQAVEDLTHSYSESKTQTQALNDKVLQAKESYLKATNAVKEFKAQKKADTTADNEYKTKLKELSAAVSNAKVAYNEAQTALKNFRSEKKTSGLTTDEYKTKEKALVEQVTAARTALDNAKNAVTKYKAEKEADTTATDQYNKELGELLLIQNSEKENLDRLLEAQQKSKTETAYQKGELTKAKTALEGYTKEAESAEKNINALKIAQLKLNQELKEMTDVDVVGSVERFASITGALQTAFNTLAQATKYLSTVAVGGIGAIVNYTKDWETSFVNVKKVIKDVSHEGINMDDVYTQVADEIKEMSKSIPADLDTIAASFANAAQLGVDTEELNEFVQAMLELDSATNIVAEDAAIQTAQFFNMIGESDFTNVERFASALVHLGNNTATTENDILNFASALGAEAAQVGFSIPQILALSSTLSSMGLEGSRAGSSIQAIFQNVDKNVSKVNSDTKEWLTSWADMAGVSVKKFRKMWTEDAAGTFELVVKGMNDAVASGKNINNVLDDMNISGIKQNQTMLALVNSYPLLAEAMDLAEEGWEDGTKAAQEAGNVWDTFASKITILMNNLKLLAINIGETLLPIITPFIEKITEVVQGFMDMDEETKLLTLKVLAFTAALSPVASILGKFFGSLKNIANVVKALLISKNITYLSDLKDYIAMLDTNVVNFFKGVGGWFVKTGDGLKGLWTKLISFREGINSGTVTLKSIIQGFGNTIKNVFTNGVSSVKGLWSALTAHPFVLVIAALAALVASFIYAWNNVDGFKETMMDLWNKIKSNLIPIFQDLWGYLKQFWEWFKTNILPKLLTAMSDVWVVIAELFAIISDVLAVVWQSLKPFLEWVAPILADMAEFLTKVFCVALTAIITTVGKIIDKVKSAVDWFKKLIGYEEKSSSANVSSSTLSTHTNGSNYVADLIPSGGFGINTRGLANIQSGGSTLTLSTSITVNNNGTPINETEIRRWGNTITDIVSTNLGRRLS